MTERSLFNQNPDDNIIHGFDRDGNRVEFPDISSRIKREVDSGMSFEEVAEHIKQEMNPNHPLRNMSVDEAMNLELWKVLHPGKIKAKTSDGQARVEFENMFEHENSDIPPEEK